LENQLECQHTKAVAQSVRIAAESKTTIDYNTLDNIEDFMSRPTPKPRLFSLALVASRLRHWP